MAFDGQASRLGPGRKLAIRSLPALRRQRRGDVGERSAVGGQLGQARGPGLGRGGQIGAGVWRQLESLLDMPPVKHLAPALIADGAGGLAGQRDSVPDACQRGRDRKWLVDHLAARIRHCEQVAGEIAAVDRRHVSRLEPAEIAGVVPVVQVPAEPLQVADG